MNNTFQNTHNDCEQFEPLVSALIDGELTTDEEALIQDHLDQCVACQQLMHDFQSVNETVDILSEARPETSDHQATETFVVTRHKPSLKAWMSVWRLAPLAGVAALLIGLFIVMSQPPQKATAEQLSPEEFVKPMADLHRINTQQERDQKLMLKTLGMDLRTLKLELSQLENTRPEERSRIEAQIELMLERVRNFESAENEINQ